MEQQRIKGYKAFKKGMVCSPNGDTKQYAENSIAEVEGKPSACNKGIHFCPNPLDVLNYYPPFSEFAEVESIGDVDREGDKVSTNKLKIGKKITIFQLYEAHFKEVFANVNQSKNTQQTSGYKSHSQTSGNESHSQTSGNESHSQTSGDESHSQTSGYKSHSQTSGNESHSQTSGYKSHSQTSGNESHSQTSGYKSHSQTSGYKSHSQTSGYKSHSQTSGNESIACSLGYQGRAKAVDGWIVIVDWRVNDNYDRYIHNIHNAQVGKQIKGIKIKPDTWYWFEDGDLKSE